MLVIHEKPEIFNLLLDIAQKQFKQGFLLASSFCFPVLLIHLSSNIGKARFRTLVESSDESYGAPVLNKKKEQTEGSKSDFIEQLPIEYQQGFGLFPHLPSLCFSFFPNEYSNRVYRSGKNS